MPSYGLLASGAQAYRIETKLDHVLQMLGAERDDTHLIVNNQRIEMANVSDLEADEASLKSALTDLLNLDGEILQKLQALTTNPAIPPDVQASLDDLHSKFHDDIAKITARVSADGNAISPNGGTTNPAPFIGSIDPDNGPAGTVVTITGTGFTGTTDVSFGGVDVASTDISVASDTSISVSAPGGGATGPVSVTTSNGTSNTKTFTYPDATQQPPAAPPNAPADPNQPLS